ncbi:NAD-dependent epimerase/dehydratase family protein [Microbacterium sp. P04]|uniref:NAD-dependent epimerase/dehydratase family protein n=1 Tax=Microbacterium sp. P04 TaxID=3366947 RepID=UPI003745E2DC
MKLLILGGTAWLGRTVAETALAQNHDVTCVARGTGAPVGARLIRADRDDEGALDAVAAERWDAVIDVGRQPGHVRWAAAALAETAGRYVFVSSANVYASQAEHGADEGAALLAPLTADAYTSPDDYGAAKVACETAVLDAFGEARSAIVRAGLIGGPGDPSGRTTYWPRRFARPSSPSGEVLIPDAPDLPTAIIDVRDLAAWLVQLADGGASGTYNAQGDVRAFADHLAAARAVTGHAGPLVVAAEDWLRERDVAEWSGPRSLPLWLADRTWWGMNDRSTARARGAGLAMRPLSETLADALAAGHAEGKAGLSDPDERVLLTELTREQP